MHFPIQGRLAWGVRGGARALTLAGLSAALLASGCGDDEDDERDKACIVGTSENCDGDRVCEEVVSGEPACFAPVVIRGRVVDLVQREGIEGATVVALDINGSARSSVVLSGDDGGFDITLPVQRDAEGVPQQDSVTLRVAAAGYQSFPVAPREALPIDLGAAEDVDDEDDADALVVMNAATEIGLVPLAGGAGGLVTVTGSIDHELASGALVVAVQGERAVSTAIADLDGAFTLFNVPAGESRIEAYRSGVNVAPETLSGEAGERVEDVVLHASTEGLARVSGSVNIVNAEGGLMTSVILVLESTYLESPGLARGIAPAGLRAAGVANAFAIEGVPPGKYAVLAAFENDQLVRDPDEGIAGTDVVHIDVAAGADHGLAESFKITQSLAVMSPGANQLELLAEGADPSFVWADDSSEDGYELRVFDAFGELVHEALDVARVNGGGTVTHTWSGAELQTGMIYQFRVMSFREGRGAGGGRAYISATEDLRGVFQVGSAPADGGASETQP